MQSSPMYSDEDAARITADMQAATGRTVDAATLNAMHGITPLMYDELKAQGYQTETLADGTRLVHVPRDVTKSILRKKFRAGHSLTESEIRERRKSRKRSVKAPMLARASRKQGGTPNASGQGP